MNIAFCKYQGNGNDFIFIDDRTPGFERLESSDVVAQMCDRRFGIGADGLICLRNHPEADFEMVYFNADGNIGSMCGNGGRCAIHYANHLGIIEDHTHFMAFDGIHQGKMLDNGWISLEMRPTPIPSYSADESYEIDTGSPHYVKFVNNLSLVEVVEEGRSIRNSPKYKDEGINVNFVKEISPGKLRVYTYERGVEDETLACGTGVTAAAISYITKTTIDTGNISIETKGGPMNVRLSRNKNGFDGIWLEGPVARVFEGTWIHKL